ncbi:DUF7544 domain-containing protein [Natrinema longum]|uniref:Membrane domain of glycerophosphoryl diester phosphodiesterase n=1 Tax=Natrinema longum TaxID=370324 RepID=A0A8A2U8V4_9EURY|nr:hypothetical protein [Natrinema longum]MBZ6493550.1 hypothetical protein [Natrinema longum]QSW85104.1 hypothetical protein J0X27_16925 [Natrinema longum]
MDAIDDISDAIDVTRNRLTPVRRGTWLRLALVVFFVSSLGFGAPGFPGGNTDTGPEGPTVDGEQPTEEVLTEEVLFWVLVILAIVLVLWLVYEAIAAVMEFVFLESLRSSEVHVRRYFSANLGKGLWLFAFRLGLRVVVGLFAIAPAVLLFLSMDAGFGGATIVLLVPYLLYALALGLVYAIVMRFTTDFVTPVMLLEDRGVLDSWSRFWTTIKANWAEYVVYLLLVWILQFVVGIAASFVIAFGGLILAIPFGIVVFLLVVTLDTVGAILAILVAIVGLLLFTVLALLLAVPITTYFRYYALLVLGDTEGDFDLIPDRREAVRDGGGGPIDRTGRGDENGSSGFDPDDGPDSDRSNGRDDRDDDRWDDEPGDRNQGGDSDEDDWR